VPTPDFDSECFLISPIGEEESSVRKRANGVMRAIVEPAAKEHELHVVRADEMTDPGTITAQIVEHLVGAKLVVADLSEENSNVFYELAVRDAAHLPAVMIAEAGTPLPFDKAGDRTIFFDSSDLASVWDAKENLAAAVGAALEGKISNPIATAMVFKQFAASGEPVQEAIAQLGEQVSQVAADVHDLKRGNAMQEALKRRIGISPSPSYGGGAIQPGAYVTNTGLPPGQLAYFGNELGTVAPNNPDHFQYLRGTPPSPSDPDDQPDGNGDNKDG
jgi:hypothetical protein